MMAASERTVEIAFLFKAIVSQKPKIILDVGYAGAKYAKDILARRINLVGLDSDETRIKGDSFKASPQEKQAWKSVASKIPVLIKDITKYPSIYEEYQTYEMVISISSIEHIVPAGYNNSFDNSLTGDLTAITNMKKLVDEDGSMLITIPCGNQELILYNQKNNKIAQWLRQDRRFVASCKDIMIYSEERIQKMIGDWRIVSMEYWTRKGGIASHFIRCDADQAFSKRSNIEHVPVQSVCGFHIKRQIKE